MSGQNCLRLTGQQHQMLSDHLFPGDGNEAVALVLCGRLGEGATQVLCVHEVLPVPHEMCRVRKPDLVTWPPTFGHELFERAAAKSMAVLKVHSHPGGYAQFSDQDDSSDKELFASLHAWTNDGLSHASAVMLPDGAMFGRTIDRDGNFHQLDRILVAGDEIRIFTPRVNALADTIQLRTCQTFGEGTMLRLKTLRIGIIGCSGTGSWVAEQLARLGVVELVLVDMDIIETKNLNRIVNSRFVDALNRKPKVEVLQKALLEHGTGTVVTALQASVLEEPAARLLATCDILFGCMDSVEGRDRLNRLAAFYLIPYFDLGVRLDADGNGGISNVCGTVNYLLPDGSSLLSRGCYSAETLRTEVLRRLHPEQYESELKEGYIKGAKVESPAVISVNGFCATMAVNELLARIHPFRGGRNADERRQQFDIKNSFWFQLEDTGPCPILSKWAGRGDMPLFLNCVNDA